MAREPLDRPQRHGVGSRRHSEAAEQRRRVISAAVVAHRNGDPRALGTLMMLCDPQMRRVARRYVDCDQDAEDAAQTAWLAFADAVHTIDAPAAAGSWLCVTTSRAAIMISRKRSRLRLAGAAPPEPPPLDGDGIDDDVIVLDERRAAVRDAVGRLQATDRELIELLFDTELTYEEISARTGRPIGGIGPTRARVIAKLRRDAAIQRWAPGRSA
ncbi:MAG: sigma-70 family RNA polymerase sigma factor [Actinomycetota bacterium]|nr:sigma-70 family RNA polymerase sigma factor [Actinomycetota bacterium]